MPRPFILRLLLARVGDGWQVMPGGFVRIADDLDARAVNLQQGGRTADAWVLSDKPVGETTLLPTPDRITINRDDRRAAEPRRRQSVLAGALCRAHRGDAAAGAGAGQPRHRKRRSGNVRHSRISSLLGAWDAVPTDILHAKPALVATAALQRDDLTGALPYLVGAAQSAASVIRDRFSPDAWRALTDLAAMINVAVRAGRDGRRHHRARQRRAAHHRVVLRPRAGKHEPARRLALPGAWPPHRARARDLPLRAPVRVRRQPDGALDVLLELADSQITYRLRYVMVAARAPVIDLVALDPNNPRSLVYQLARIRRISRRCRSAAMTAACRRPSRSRRVATKMRTTDAAMMDDDVFVDGGSHADEALRRRRRRPISPRTSAPKRPGNRSDDLRRPADHDLHYASPVAYAHHVLRLTPIDRPHQRVHAAALDIMPTPIERREGQDFFGNHITWIALDQPHDTLTVRVAARVAVDATAAPGSHAALGGCARRRLRQRRSLAEVAGAFSVSEPPGVARSGNPRLCGRRAFRRAAGPRRRDRSDASHQGRLHLRDRRHHGVDHAADVVRAAARRVPGFRAHHDFRHALARPAGGLCQRLLCGPRSRPGETRLEGADAMHAWVLVWCGAEAGWIGLDPTNGILAGNDHVVLAIGRDYADVAPIDGVIFASGAQRLKVSVSVTPIG